MVSGGDDAILRLWDSSNSWSHSDIANVASKKPAQVATLAVTTNMRGVCIIAAATTDHNVALFDMSQQGKFKGQISPHRSNISIMLPFHNTVQGQHGLITASHDGTFCIFILS
mmetsp:Transcript_11005/g.21563  ORF Transcript_11005/g.21563 Transcript_11005/m.21563 type:complete len:113 (+) Transcript_11005:1044-1382(+)